MASKSSRTYVFQKKTFPVSTFDILSIKYRFELICKSLHSVLMSIIYSVLQHQTMEPYMEMSFFNISYTFLNATACMTNCMRTVVLLLLQKRGLLQRACRLALLLWLLLLALLLLAFLLPLMDEGNSCSLSNNFARSFNIMLRYDGPPPT